MYTHGVNHDESSAHYVQNFALDDVRCTGTESRIQDCPHRDWYKHNCNKSEAVGVECR